MSFPTHLLKRADLYRQKTCIRGTWLDVINPVTLGKLATLPEMGSEDTEVGAGDDDGVTVGPLTSGRAVEKTAKHVQGEWPDIKTFQNIENNSEFLFFRCSSP